MPEITPVVSSVDSTEEIKRKAEDHEAFMDIQQKMQWITNEMRESPLPPSEQINPNDTNRLIKVEMPPEGGVKTYMSNFDEPYLGFPYHELVVSMDVVKKMTKGFKSGFYHLLWKYLNKWTKWPILAITYPFFRIYAKAEIYTCWRYLERHKIKPRYYCRAMREVYRAMSLTVNENEKYSTGKLREQIRDLLCMHLEFDNAYRFRFQDAVVNLNKKELEKDSVKEIIRLFDLVSEREVRQEVKDSWTLTKWMIEYLRLNGEIREIMVSFLNNLHIQKCELAKEDWPYCKSREDYRFVNKNFKQEKI